VAAWSATVAVNSELSVGREYNRQHDEYNGVVLVVQLRPVKGWLPGPRSSRVTCHVLYVRKG
jgi:hypothetical protein